MTVIFRKDGGEITEDFVVTRTISTEIRVENEDGTVTYQPVTVQDDVTIPYENLPLYDDATLADLGVTKVTITPVPTDISDRQFFQQLALVGIITKEEALAAVKVGTIPSALSTFIAALPSENDRFNAEMILSGATIFYRQHPMVAAVGAANGMTSDQIDQFFIAASQL